MNTTLQNQIVQIIRSSPYSEAVGEISIVGSYARGEETPESDIDIIIDLRQSLGLHFFTLQALLTDQLGKKVDLLTKKWVSPRILPQMEKDKIVLS